MKSLSVLLLSAISAIPAANYGQGWGWPGVSYEYGNIKTPNGMDFGPWSYNSGMQPYMASSPYGNYGNFWGYGRSQDNTSDQQKLDELNAVRAKVGAPPLKLSQKLKQAAQKHSDDQARMHNMSHTGSDGSDPNKRIEAAGIKAQGYTGENVAYNTPNWSATNKAWEKSPGHYRNMVDENFKYVGFGFNNMYYTEDFSATD